MIAKAGRPWQVRGAESVRALNPEIPGSRMPGSRRWTPQLKRRERICRTVAQSAWTVGEGGTAPEGSWEGDAGLPVASSGTGRAPAGAEGRTWRGQPLPQEEQTRTGQSPAAHLLIPKSWVSVWGRFWPGCDSGIPDKLGTSMPLVQTHGSGPPKRLSTR